MEAKKKQFAEKVIAVVAKIPKGRVASYGQIAALVSTPRAARAVGMILSRLPRGTSVPWHRVLNYEGRISIENIAVPKKLQAALLQKEGVRVIYKDGNYWVDLEKHQMNF